MLPPCRDALKGDGIMRSRSEQSGRRNPVERFSPLPYRQPTPHNKVLSIRTENRVSCLSSQIFLVFSQKTSPSSHSVEIWAYGLCPNLPDTICMGLGSFVNRQLPFPGARLQTGHRPYVKLHIRPIMHSPRLCEVKDRNAHQVLIDRGNREFRLSHNHSVFRKLISESGAR